ncbi:hypothetical protein GCM10011506_44420 [Marivirga lumbricoides]|uniref:YD repeat-containing protein n=2 Tax=Marivirga lumbricoides TaxID=1046115 RepID=A0ABQ1N934_9BACT|nr:hypothetical protein GCM10011506_44420 [Marivirga lumbricoides]
MLSCNEEDENVNPDPETEENADSDPETEGDVDNDPEEEKTCLVTKFYTEIYSVNITYDEKEQVDRINYSRLDNGFSVYLDYQYNDESKVSTINYYLEDGTLVGYYTQEYNSDGQLIEETYHEKDSETDEMSFISYQRYSYDEKSRLVRVDYYDALTDEILNHTLYTKFDSVGNFLEVEYYGGDGTLTKISEFTYDDKPNARLSLNGFYYGYEAFYSTPNNITKIVVKNSDDVIVEEDGISFTYSYNPEGYPTKAESGDNTVNYEYNCN